jgi:ubiquinone/menaquinone biosynthesis C-methylase UbiE
MLLKIALLILTAMGSAPASFLPPADRPQAVGTAQAADRLTDSDEQRSNQDVPPGLIMDLAGVKPGMIIGEVGAGRGRITVHLADRVGDKGRVYANDIDSSSLDYLRSRVRRLDMSNIEVIQGTVEDALLPAGQLDMALMVLVYHHLDEPVALLKNLLPSLKAGGIVAMVEPNTAHTERGRRDLTREQVAKEAREAGYRLESMIEGKMTWCNVFILRPETAAS